MHWQDYFNFLKNDLEVLHNNVTLTRKKRATTPKNSFCILIHYRSYLMHFAMEKCHKSGYPVDRVAALRQFATTEEGVKRREG